MCWQRIKFFAFTKSSFHKASGGNNKTKQNKASTILKIPYASHSGLLFTVHCFHIQLFSRCSRPIEYIYLFCIWRPLSSVYCETFLRVELSGAAKIKDIRALYNLKKMNFYIQHFWMKTVHNIDIISCMSNYCRILLVITFSPSEDRSINGVIHNLFCSVIDHRGRQNVVRTSFSDTLNRVTLFRS